MLGISIGANISFVNGKPSILRSHQLTGTENVTELEGSVVIKVGRFNRLYPSIEIPDNQLLNVTATIVGDFFYVNSVLRINIDTHILDPEYTYKIGRHLKTFVMITRPEYSFLGKIVGKAINFNRSNFLSGTTTIDIPFTFKSTENYEEFKIRIFAMNSVIGAFSLKYPSITYKVLNFKCYYYEPHDIFPPVTTSHLYGTPYYVP